MNYPPPRIPEGISRRHLLAGFVASLGLVSSVAAASPTDRAEGGQGARVRLALLVGNRLYPEPYDLPPVHKNVRDLQEALTQRGFTVTATVDQGLTALRQVIAQFAQDVRAAPPDTPVLFYFTGHGMQIDAENLLLGADTNPSAREPVLLGGSLHFKRDVLDSLPLRPQGLTMTVLDACRTSLRAAAANSDGFNQVEAPPGCVIAFSTGAGKPAIAPAVETQNTFYTASLLKVLRSASDDITFSDLFRLVKSDVQQTMLNHKLAAIRQMAQVPFIAENVRTRFPLSLRAGAGSEKRFDNNDEAASWKALQSSTWPADVIRLSTAFLERFPQSGLAGSATVALEGAQEADKAVRRNDVRLFKSAFALKDEHPVLSDELRKAARGDKDAAARMGRYHRTAEHGVPTDDNRYQGWLQFASALGNGIAAYELALHYRSLEQPVLASQFESRARELGYTPPSTLDHSRK